MRKLLILLITVFILSGCKQKNDLEINDSFILSEKKQAQYVELIDETLKSFYWYYDSDSLTYFKGAIPNKDEQNQNIFDASNINGFDLSKYSGREDVVYSCELLHFNRNAAGTAYFYFVNKEIAGCYYIPSANDELVLDFKTRNVFVKGTKIEKKETNASEITYKEFSGSSAPNGFISEGRAENGNGIYLSLEGDILRINKFNGKGFNLVKSISKFEGELVPISGTFMQDGSIAILLGSKVETGAESQEYINVSEKLIFLNRSYEATGEEIVLTKGTYSCVGSEENNIILINDRTLDVFAKGENGWENLNSYNIGVQALFFASADVDKDGNVEYFISDKKDLFVFRKEGHNFNCIWRTNISVESFSGGIYLGDTNGDDAMEIYTMDTMGTSIRYGLSKNGLVAMNENIEYGDIFYVGDFNGDGITDYILSRGAESPTKSVYIAEK